MTKSTFMLHQDNGHRARCGRCTWTKSADDTMLVYKAAVDHAAKHLREDKQNEQQSES